MDTIIKPELIQKGMSRCFVFSSHHIEKVRGIIKVISEFEYEYLPDNWITLWKDDNALVYNGKFDIDIPRLTEACGLIGVGIMIKSTNFDGTWL